MDCIFCKIISGEIPCYKIYEDEHTLAFLDIVNDAYGHTLVIPKNHAVNMLDCDSETLSHTMKTVKLIAKHFTESCGFEGINIMNANDACAGQSVFHLHFHIIPRKKNDGLNAWPDFGKNPAELAEVLERLKIKQIQ